MPDLDIRKAFRVLVTHDMEGLNEEDIDYLVKELRRKKSELIECRQDACSHEFKELNIAKPHLLNSNFYDRMDSPSCKKCNIRKDRALERICEHDMWARIAGPGNKFFSSCIYCIRTVTGDKAAQKLHPKVSNCNHDWKSEDIDEYGRRRGWIRVPMFSCYKCKSIISESWLEKISNEQMEKEQGG